MQPEAFQKAFGQALRTARERLGLSQEQVAEQAGLDRKLLSHLELGRLMPLAYTVRVLALVLHVSTDELLGPWPEAGGRHKEQTPSRELRQVLALLRPWTGPQLERLLRVLRALEEPPPDEEGAAGGG